MLVLDRIRRMVRKHQARGASKSLVPPALGSFVCPQKFSMESHLLAENASLKSKVAELEARLKEIETKEAVESYSCSPFPDFAKGPILPLSKREVERYGRQLIMKEIAATGTII